MKKFLFFLSLIFGSAVWAQQPNSAPPEEDIPPAKAPVLIRDEADKAPEPVERDPAKAQAEVEIGDFYFKRDNFRAAIGRYQEALQYRPDYPLAYEKLIRALERTKDLIRTRKLMQEYVEKFPSEKMAAEYTRLLSHPPPAK